VNNMRHIIVAVLLMFTSSVFAMNAIESQLKDSPQMSKRCIEKINYYEKKIVKYRAIPENKRRRVHKIKLNYYTNELVNWQEYCYGTENSD